MGKNWALTIGINQYYNLQDLNYAKRDAELVRHFFLNEAGFEEVFFFSDDSPEIIPYSGKPIPTQPTFGNLRRFLRAQFEERLMAPGDNFWFFFSGHGMRFADRDYLMPCDADPEDVEHTAISINYVTDRLRRSGADNVVLILDACRNQGQKDGRGVGDEEHPGVITIFSCSANEKSYEIEDENYQQGSFTYALLEGLRLQGEANCATVERLYQHLRHRVPEINRWYGKPQQTPYLMAEPPYKMHFILLNQRATLKDAEPLKFQASIAENRGDFDLAKQLWIRVLSVSKIDRDAIEAIERIALKKIGQPNSLPQPPVTTNTSGLKSSVSELPRLSATPSDKLTIKSSSEKRSENPLIPSTHTITSEKRRAVRLSVKGVEFVKSTLKRKGWTQKALAEHCCLSRTIISRFLRQEPIDANTFDVICKALDLNAEEILDHPPAIPSISNTQRIPSSKTNPLPSTIHTFEFEVISVDVWGKELERCRKTSQHRIEALGNGMELELVLIPSGTFLMGSPKTEVGQINNEEPHHSVTVKSFLMGKYPITQTQWKVVASFPKVYQDLKLDPSHFKGADQPVEQVSWHDAVEFCARLSNKTGHEYRLPTEAEWEYACRAGTTTPFHFGETITPKLSNYDCNYSYRSGPKGTYRKQTSPVQYFSFANAFGLFDMHGNVWEWCLDHWQESYDNAPTNGSAWLTERNNQFRVLRGGSWYNAPRDCRSAFRFYWDSDDRVNRIGFRVVCPVIWTP
jgi:formylglycine-generating enzyme required for sulfatase activity/uncharacterized caspase-like protein